MPATTTVNTPERILGVVQSPVAAATKIFAGALVALNSNGYAVPAADTAGLRVIGRAEHTVDNSTGANGDVAIAIKRGVFRYNNSDANAVTAAHVGTVVFAEDDMTVGATSANKVAAGVVVVVDDEGVWFDTRANAGAIAVVLTSTNGTAAAAVDDAALKAEAEKIGDDVRAIYAALKAQGILG